MYSDKKVMATLLTSTLLLSTLPAASKDTGVEVSHDMRTFFNYDCPAMSRDGIGIERNVEMAPLLSGLVTAVVPNIINTGLGLLGSALRKASGKDSNTITLESSGGTEMHIYNSSHHAILSNPQFNCVIVAMGRFGEGTHWAPKPGGKNPAIPAFFSERMKLLDSPDFYLESHVIQSGQLAGFRLIPSYLYYKQWLNTKGKKAPRDLSITFSFYTPDDGEDKPFGIARMDFNDFPQNTALSITELTGKETIWIAGRPLDSAVAEAVGTIKSKMSEKETLSKEIDAIEKPDEALEKLEEEVRMLQCKKRGDKQEECAAEEVLYKMGRKIERQKISDKKRRLEALTSEINSIETGIKINSQVNTKITLVETAEINEWLLAVADTLDASKAKISETVQSYIIPEQRQQRELAEQSQKIDQLSAYKRAIIDVKIAEMELDKERKANPAGSKSVLEAEKTLVTKKTEANKTALLAGLPSPYPGL